MNGMETVTGSMAIRHEEKVYSLYFSQRGWLAAEMVRYLDRILQSEQPEVEILKLLGYTMQIHSEFPPRTSDHWVEIELEKATLHTNSPVIRAAVKQAAPEPDLPFAPEALPEIYEVLDRHDFTVMLK